MLRFQPFTFSTDNCIYDKFEYSIVDDANKVLDLAFASFDVEKLTVSIKTNNLNFIGMYSLYFLGRVADNPYLEYKYPINLILEEYI